MARLHLERTATMDEGHCCTRELRERPDTDDSNDYETSTRDQEQAIATITLCRMRCNNYMLIDSATPFSVTIYNEDNDTRAFNCNFICAKRDRGRIMLWFTVITVSSFVRSLSSLLVLTNITRQSAVIVYWRTITLLAPIGTIPIMPVFISAFVATSLLSLSSYRREICCLLSMQSTIFSSLFSLPLPKIIAKVPPMFARSTSRI